VFCPNRWTHGFAEHGHREHAWPRGQRGSPSPSCPAPQSLKRHFSTLSCAEFDAKCIDHVFTRALPDCAGQGLLCRSDGKADHPPKANTPGASPGSRAVLSPAGTNPHPAGTRALWVLPGAHALATNTICFSPPRSRHSLTLHQRQTEMITLAGSLRCAALIVRFYSATQST